MAKDDKRKKAMLENLFSEVNDVDESEAFGKERTPKKERKPARAAIRTVRIDELIENEFNEFTIKDDEEFQQLYTLIKNNGQTEEIVVVQQENGLYRILSGHRRFRIMKELGFEKVKVQIKPEFESPLDEKLYITAANLGKRLVTAYDMAATIKSMVVDLPKEFTKTETENYFVENLGIARSSYYTYIKLAELPNELIEVGKFGGLTRNEGIEIINTFSDDERQNLIDEIKKLGDYKEDPKDVQEYIKKELLGKKSNTKIESSDKKEVKKSNNFNTFLKRTDGLVEKFDFENLKLPKQEAKKAVARTNLDTLIEKLVQLREKLDD